MSPSIRGNMALAAPMRAGTITSTRQMCNVPLKAGDLSGRLRESIEMQGALEHIRSHTAINKSKSKSLWG